MGKKRRIVLGRGIVVVSHVEPCIVRVIQNGFRYKEFRPIAYPNARLVVEFTTPDCQKDKLSPPPPRRAKKGGGE